MLDHPVAAILEQIFELILLIVAGLIFVAIIFFILFKMAGDAVVEAFDFHTNIIIGVPLTCLFVAVLLVVLSALVAIVPALKATLREWSRVGNRMALMLGFVALFFLSADCWRLTGAIPVVAAEDLRGGLRASLHFRALPASETGRQ